MGHKYAIDILKGAHYYLMGFYYSIYRLNVKVILKTAKSVSSLCS